MSFLKDVWRQVVLGVLVAALSLVWIAPGIGTRDARAQAVRHPGGGEVVASARAPTAGYNNHVCVPFIARPSGLPSNDTTPVYSYRVANTYPHDQHAFTQGLVWDGGSLYEGTGLYGSSSVRQVALATGEVLQSTPLPAEHFGEGVTAFGDTILQLTWRSNVGFVYDKAGLNQTGQFTYPTEGWGLTHDGDSLIMSDGTEALHFLDPQTFAETRTITVVERGVPVTRLNELEYVRGEIWANVWLTDRIARISPVSGLVVAWIDLAGLRPASTLQDPDAVLNGIAYDPATNRVFVTGKLWPALYEIELVEPARH